MLTLIIIELMLGSSLVIVIGTYLNDLTSLYDTAPQGEDYDFDNDQLHFKN